MKKHIVTVLCGGLFASSMALAGNWNVWLNNNTTYPWVLTNVSGGPSGETGYCTGSSCYPVIQAVKGSNGQGITIPAQSSYLVLDYNVCSSVSYNAQHQPSCNGYIDHITVNINHVSSKLTDGKSLFKMQFQNPNFNVSLVNPPVPPKFPTPQTYQTTRYRGVNLSGFEWGNGTMPPATYFPTAKDALYFVKQGANTIRLPIEWKYLQPSLSGPIGGNSYDNQIKTLIKTLTDAKVNVILDLHDYMRYGGTSSNQVVGAPGSPATVADLTKVWQYLANEYKGNSQVIFDLMNEPYENAQGYPAPKDVVSIYNQVIAGVRGEGAKNLILLEGDDWTGLHSWASSGNAAAFAKGQIKDPDNHFAINVHQYFNGPSYSGNGTERCDDPKQYLDNIDPNGQFADWLKTNGYQAFITEFGGQAPNPTNDPNGYCDQDMQQLLAYMQSHHDQFSGYTAWTAGHAWTMGGNDSPLDLSPTATGAMKPQMQTLITSPGGLVPVAS